LNCPGGAQIAKSGAFEYQYSNVLRADVMIRSGIPARCRTCKRSPIGSQDLVNNATIFVFVRAGDRMQALRAGGQCPAKMKFPSPYNFGERNDRTWQGALN